MKVEIYKEQSTEDVLEHALGAIGKLIEVRTSMGQWELASLICSDLYLLGLDSLARDVLQDDEPDGALAVGPIERVKELRRKVYDYLGMGE